MRMALSPETTEILEGIVERITFHSDESGYTVARLKTTSARDLLTIIGSFASIDAGQTLRLTGFWREHPKFGQQFEVQYYEEIRPATLTGIEKYLGSGLIKGIGPVTARRIVTEFGLDTLEVIESQSERLLEIPGISHGRVKRIQAAWEAQKAIKEVMVFLQGHGVSTTYAAKIFKQYGQEVIATVTHNPYQLAADIYGIGFLTADKIARKLGIAPDSDFRYRAGILYVLSEAAEEGHCYLPQQELLERVVQQLSLPDAPVDPTRIQDLLDHMALQGELMIQPGAPDQPEDQRCYQPSFFHTEQHLAKLLIQLARCPVEVDLQRVQRWVDRYTEHHHITLSAQQREAVELAAQSRVVILTGGPGCGKTFTTRTIVALWKAMGKTLALAAPTGRAAQRLSELTGQEAKTLHRLLEFDPASLHFRHNAENPLQVQALVVDEASMLDLFLAHALVRAVPLEAQLLLVGDSDQLPSVGPGNVLRDMIASGCVPVVRLTEVFRQAQASQIVTTAHQVQQGHIPKLQHIASGTDSDCLWVNVPDPEEALPAIGHLITTELPQRGFDPQQEMQVLSPTVRGSVGTRALNGALQKTLNPPRSGITELTRGGTTFRVGDRVIQQVNDYDREVFNGDLGTITKIDLEEQEVRVRFAERQVTYDYADLSELTLAWAVTIHKSQGSEYPAVIILLYPLHYLLLSRNLLYTALTRAKRLAILVGPMKAVAMAVNRVQVQERYTTLAGRLQIPLK